MKTIGLLGGMSWESTLSYYSAINQGVKQRLGGLHSAKICLFSVDFAEIEILQHQGDWPATAAILSQAARQIESGGADLLLICTNTMHKVADEIAENINIPLLHIADATGLELQKNNLTKVGLLGTKFTMEQNFYRQRLQDRYSIAVEIPPDKDRNFIHETIYDELCLGQINPASRSKFVEITEDLKNQGCQAVILGCTEIALLLQQSHTSVRLFDTTAIHADAAVEYALS